MLYRKLEEHVNKFWCRRHVIAAPNALTDKALDDVEQGIGLSKIYKDTDEMFRDSGA